jgi:uncharacterized coiled-coil protein SlyX
MFGLFKSKKQMSSKLFDLELKLEHSQKQIDELRELVIDLHKEINSLTLQINHLSESKWGKGL